MTVFVKHRSRYLGTTVALGAIFWTNGASSYAEDIAAPAASAIPTEVSLSALFNDSMVLQRDMSDNIWGQAPPGQHITVSFNHKTANAVADAAGNWQTKLPAQKAGGPYELTITGNNTLTLKDVYLGDVWLMSGQSNMEHDSKGSLKPEVFATESATANDPQLRIFIVKKNSLPEPTRDLSGQWQPCTPETMARFSAVGYFFGRELRQKLGVPIGLIGSYWGGTPSEAFTSQGGLEKDPTYPDLKASWEKLTADYPAKRKRYDEVILPKWQADVAKAKADGLPIPGRPGAPWGSPTNNQRPSVLYNGMIAPLIPLSLKGIGWYQGESNGDNLKEAVAYKTLFPTMIRDWRNLWGQNIPFLWVQLASYRKQQELPVEPTQAWPYVREAQTFALSLPATGMAMAIDNDDPDTIHPKDKVTIGNRLADVALATVYGQKVAYTGPLFDTMQVSGNTARLHFKHTDGGLKVRGDALKGFAIAGEDGQFVWADARIDGENVVVSSPQVAKPVTVRYDWADDPIGNLSNGAGLPASSFRTDVNTLPVIQP